MPIPAKLPLVCAFLVALLPAPNAPAEDLAPWRFDGPWILKAEWSSGLLRHADLDGDGATDFTVVDNAKSLLTAYLQKPGGEPDDFEERETVLERSASDCVLTDADNNGTVDCVLAFGDADAVWRPGEGDGGFGVERDLPFEAIWLEAGDLDGDGVIDLLASSRERLWILWGDDEGFAAAEPVETFFGAGPRGRPLVGDYDGDGRLDVLTVDAKRPDRTLVRLQKAPREFGLETACEATNLGDVAAPVFPAPGGGAPFARLAAVNPQNREIRLHALESEPLAREAFPFAGPSWLGMDARLLDGEELLEVADVDGDGLSDFIAASPRAAELTLFLQQEAGFRAFRSPSLSDVRALATAPGEHGALVFSLSAKEETISASVFEAGRGFSVPEMLDFHRKPLTMAAADFDASGGVDLAFLYESEETEDVWRLALIRDPKTPGALNAAPETFALPDVVSEEPKEMLAGDLTGDGRAEMLIFPVYGVVQLLIQRPDGTFTPFAADQGMKQGVFNEVQPRAVTLADVDGEAGLELIVARESFARAYRLNTDGGLEMVEQFNGESVASRVAATAAADLDGDGDPEIALLDAGEETLTIYARADDERYRMARRHEAPGLRAGRLLAADANGDGLDDLALSRDGGGMRLYLSGAASRRFEVTWRGEPETDEGRYVRVEGLPMRPGGGDALAALEGTEHVLRFFRSAAPDGGKRMERVFNFKLFDDESSISRSPQGGGEPREMSAADVDGDGLVDFVVLMHDNIVFYRRLADD